MKYFIIGPSGSIGSELVPALVKLGHQVSGLARSTKSAILTTELGAKVINGDINTPDTWINEAAKADVLVHLGALSPPKRGNKKWLKAAASLNTTACKGLIEAAIQGEKCKALITASGSCVVGNQKERWVIETTPKIKNALAQFWGPNEDYVFIARQKGINATALRFGQVYSSNPNGVFGKYFLKMAEKGQFRYMGKGNNFYPYVHIKDVVDAIIKTAENPNNEPILHIVDDEPINMKDSTTALLKAFGQKAKSVPIWLARIMVGKALVEGFSGSFLLKNNLAKETLGWKPAYPSFKNEVENVVKGYMDLVSSQK